MKLLNKTLTLTAIITALASPMVLAGKYDNHKRIDYARVISATPVTKTVERRVPVKNCWTEQVREEQPVYHNTRRARKSATPTLLGAAIGGGLGNAVGAGEENKKVGTVVGAILGAAIGNDISRNSIHRQPQYSHTEVSYRDVRRCEMENRVQVEEVPAGYDVSYSYRGEIYRTHTHKHPGKKMKIAVSIHPLEH